MTACYSLETLTMKEKLVSNYIDCLPENNLEKKYFKEIADEIRVALSWQKRTGNSDITIVAKNFGDPMPDVPGEKVVFMNADEQYRIPDEVNDPDIKMIFKQYCREGQHEKLRPLPLGPAKDFVYTPNAFEDRIYDVTLIGQIAQNRAKFYGEIYNFLQDDSISSFFGLYQGFNKGLDMESYSKVLSNTKIAICPHGSASPETFRFFEAMSANCVVICAHQPDNWIYRNAPYNVVANTNMIVNGVTVGSTYHIVKTLLSDPKKLKLLSDQSKQYYYGRVCAPPVAQYILSEIKEKGS